MSRENVDWVRTLIETANASGWDPKVAASFVHPEGRMYSAPDFPGQDVYVGREEIEAFVGEWISTFDDLQWKVEELVDLDDRVLLLARQVGKSKTTGAAADWHFGTIFSDFRDGMFAEARHFMDRRSALEAAGLDDRLQSNPQ